MFRAHLSPALLVSLGLLGAFFPLASALGQELKEAPMKRAESRLERLEKKLAERVVGARALRMFAQLAIKSFAF